MAMLVKLVSVLGAAALGGIIFASGTPAADFSNGSSRAWSYTPVAPATPVAPIVPAPRPWYQGGNHWRGHHSLYGGAPNPDFTFATPGWGGPWFYSPHTYYEPGRPAVVMPEPVAPLIVAGRPEPWSSQWYAYCASRFRSFEPSTGFYTTYSGDRQMCR
jgi:hypothetical protein